MAIDVVAAALTAFASGDLAKPTMPNQFYRLHILGPELTSEERRTMYENWLLAKGFQDLIRGVRESLEQAAAYLEVINNPPQKIPTTATAEDIFLPYLKRASKPSFPALLGSVNSRLLTPLLFEQEFLSMQKVRNCLEHRGGIVRQEDLNLGECTLLLTFPRMKIFYMRGAEEIEITPTEPVDAGDGKPEVQLIGRLVTRSKAYRLGEKITFSGNEFMEIAGACLNFGRELANKLPLIS